MVQDGSGDWMVGVGQEHRWGLLMGHTRSLRTEVREGQAPDLSDLKVAVGQAGGHGESRPRKLHLSRPRGRGTLLPAPRGKGTALPGLGARLAPSHQPRRSHLHSAPVSWMCPEAGQVTTEMAAPRCLKQGGAAPLRFCAPQPPGWGGRLRRETSHVGLEALTPHLTRGGTRELAELSSQPL